MLTQFLNERKTKEEGKKMQDKRSRNCREIQRFHGFKIGKKQRKFGVMLQTTH